LASPEGVLDVGVLVPLCFENPLKEEAVHFVSDVLTLKKPAVIPLTALLGAYHIVTRYLKVPPIQVKKVLLGLLETDSPAVYPLVSSDMVSDAIDYATAYNIESWDGYLISLSIKLGSSIIYSIDEDLSKVREVTVVNPFSTTKVKEYHSFIRGMLQ